MINLRERNDERHSPTDVRAGPDDRFGVAAGPSPDDVDRSVEPTPGVYLARRAVVVVAMLALLAIGATGGRYLLQSGSAPLTALAVPPDSGDQPVTEQPAVDQQPQTVPPPTLPPTAPATTEPPPTDVPATEPPVKALPEGTSRLVPLDPTRILDSQDLPSTGDAYAVELARDWVAVALSVTIAGDPDAGTVMIDGGAGAVEAIVLDQPGATSTNLVVVPTIGRNLTVWSTAGGRVIVDMVGGFEPSQATEAGRFVATEPVEIARLVTAEQGRETDLPFAEAVSGERADAYLVSIVADVGADGGMVRLGSGADDYDQVMMWGPDSAGSIERRGLVLLRPNDLGEVHLRYDGGSILTAEVVGYFTNESQPTSTTGLFVVAGPETLYEGVLSPTQPVTVDDLEPTADLALVTVSSPTTDPGRLGTFLVPVTDGRATLTPSTEINSVVTLLGVFVGDER